MDALGRFRTHFGYHIAAMMGGYDLSVEDQLGVILPPRPRADDGAPVDIRELTQSGGAWWRFWRDHSREQPIPEGSGRLQNDVGRA
jgi:hypothetical protein